MILHAQRTHTQNLFLAEHNTTRNGVKDWQACLRARPSQTCGGARRFRPVSQSHQRMGNVAAATAAQSSRLLVMGLSSLPLLLASPPTIPASGC